MTLERAIFQKVNDVLEAMTPTPEMGIETAFKRVDDLVDIDDDPTETAFVLRFENLKTIKVTGQSGKGNYVLTIGLMFRFVQPGGEQDSDWQGLLAESGRRIQERLREAVPSLAGVDTCNTTDVIRQADDQEPSIHNVILMLDVKYTDTIVTA